MIFPVISANIFISITFSNTFIVNVRVFHPIILMPIRLFDRYSRFLIRDISS